MLQLQVLPLPNILHLHMLVDTMLHEDSDMAPLSIC